MQDYYTVGAHFKGSSKLYTYKVPANVELSLGESVVVMTTTGLSFVRVKELHPKPQDTMPGVDYKFIAYTLVPIEVPKDNTSFTSAVKRL